MLAPIRRKNYPVAMNPRHSLNQSLVCWIDTSDAGGKSNSLTDIPDIAFALNPLRIVSGDYDSAGPVCSPFCLNYNGTTNRSRITNLTTHSAQRTWAMWVNRDGAGEANLGRIFDKLDSGTTSIEQFGWDNAANAAAGGYRFTRGFSTTAGVWDMTPSGLGIWDHIILSYDSSATANNPSIWLQGKPATVTRVTGPVGTASTNGSAYWFGNRGNADHTWLGQIADIRISDRLISSDGEAYNLFIERSRMYSSLYLYRWQLAYCASSKPFLLWRKLYRLMRG